jgi:hypothetical protein
MTRAMNPTIDRLGPYVFAFAAGAIALSTLASTRKAEDDRLEDASMKNDRARDEIANKLLSRLATRYRAPQARRRPLP